MIDVRFIGVYQIIFIGNKYQDNKTESVVTGLRFNGFKERFAGLDIKLVKKVNNFYDLFILFLIVRLVQHLYKGGTEVILDKGITLKMFLVDMDMMLPCSIDFSTNTL